MYVGLLCCATMASGKLLVTIVGPGSLGGALAVALYRAEYVVSEVVYRGDPRRAHAVARGVGAKAILFDKAAFDADVIWLCVGDGEISNTAKALVERAAWKGMYAFHSSGALSSDELRPLKRRGASIASVHPMMSFVRSAEATFESVPFALEGDILARRVAGEIAKALAGSSFELKKKDKPLYHALGAFSSPLLVAHLAATEQIGKKLGLRAEETRKIIGPILQKTLRNYLEHGPAAALSGPMARGDVETVRRNLKALRRVSGAGEIYRAAAKMAVKELPVKNKAAMAKVLSE
jgi:predicted short-subunit dehydrogenase-like oxidoreductase (DUF2520 family)